MPDIARQKNFDRDKAQLQALRLFWRKGYEATSIEDLVEVLQISRSSLYDTFGDKRTLFLDALRLYSTLVTGRIGKMLGETPSLAVGLEAFFNELTEGVGTESGAMGCFMVNSVAELVPYDREVAEIAATYSQSVQWLLMDALLKSPEPPALLKQTPEQVAAYLFNTMQGLRVLIKSGATREVIGAITAITLDQLR